MRPLCFLSVLTAALAALGARPAFAANSERPLVHPIYSKLPDLAEDDFTRRAFAAATARYKLAPLEIIDVPAAPAPRAPMLLKSAVTKALRLAFDEALADLEGVIAELDATGGAGLTRNELADVFLYRGMAVARADWKALAATDGAAMSAARAQAFADYARAAVLAPDRALNPREVPPQVVADFARAVAEARQQPRASLAVRGDADATVSMDGAAPARVAGGVTFHDVTYGEHFLAVEELGRAPWGKRLAVGAPTVDEAIPPRAALTLDDRIAADHARRMGALFALVAERKPGPGAQIELRLVDLSGAKRDAALVSTTRDEHGALDAAVMRLDEEARRIQQVLLAGGAPPPVAVAAPPDTPAPILAAPPPARATFRDDPLAWARDRWPLMTAIGVVVGAALVLSVAAAN
ncbi:MAG TPA: hypothetical protein VG319_02405 [Polyangia bacterium]|nr:hypothetical protein [Polyangia bacterium]